MIRNETLSEISDRRVLIGIAIIPIVDCVCNQLNNALKIGMGSLSFLQIMRGGCFSS